MKRITSFILLLAIVMSIRANETCSVGLVLSGGGAKGIAHIGVIQALEDNNIPIDYITGTSMGAIVGSLYASGYTPEEMLQLIGSQGFADWSTGKPDAEAITYLLVPEKTPAFFNLNLGVNDSSKMSTMLPTSIINPLPMNFAFLELYSAYTAQCDRDFDRLFVPFRCVTSNVFDKHKVVLRSGNLGDAVRMSMSFPMIFEPIEIDGLPMYDGGIYDNFPIDVMMTEFAPDAVIGVDVSTASSPNTRNMLDRMEAMIMQPDHYPFPDDKGVYIHINLSEFGLLDFQKYKEIYDIGYAHGLEMMDSIKSKVSSRIPALTRKIRRETFKAMTPAVVFDSVKVTGAKPRQNAYISSLFHRSEADTFGLSFARKAYYRAITPGRLMNLVPYPAYNPVDSAFTLNLKALVKDQFSLGLGGYISSSTNSMLFLTGGYNTLSFNSMSATANLWVGQSYLAATGELKLLFPSDTPSEWRLQLEATQQKFTESEKLFFEALSPNFVTKSEVIARTSYSIASSRQSISRVSIGYGHLTDRFFARNDQGIPVENRARSIWDLGSASLEWTFSNTDNTMAPTDGSFIDAQAAYIFGRQHYKIENYDLGEYDNPFRQWLQIKAKAYHYFNLSRHFSLGLSAEGVLSTRKLLASYDASIIAAPAFNPTAATYDYFNPRLRANSFIAGGLQPVWKISQMFQLRGSFNAFVPYKRIVLDDESFRATYSKAFDSIDFVGEISAVINLPFGNIRGYAQYVTTPGEKWNAGISIGTFILAPKFF